MMDYTSCKIKEVAIREGINDWKIPVAIARAIVNNPKLLLCDEPTGNLDPEKSMEIMKVLDDINKNRGTTIIMATHDKDIVNKMKKQVLTLKDGHLVNYKQKGTYNNESA